MIKTHPGPGHGHKPAEKWWRRFIIKKDLPHRPRLRIQTQCPNGRRRRRQHSIEIVILHSSSSRWESEGKSFWISREKQHQYWKANNPTRPKANGIYIRFYFWNLFFVVDVEETIFFNVFVFPRIMVSKSIELLPVWCSFMADVGSPWWEPCVLWNLVFWSKFVTNLGPLNGPSLMMIMMIWCSAMCVWLGSDSISCSVWLRQWVGGWLDGWMLYQAAC